MGFMYCNVKPIFAKLVEESAFLNKKYNSTKHSNRTTIKVCSIHAKQTQIYAIIKVESTPIP